MNKRQAKHIALTAAFDALQAEVFSPTGVTLALVETEVDHDKVLEQLQLLANAFEARLNTAYGGRADDQ